MSNDQDIKSLRAYEEALKRISNAKNSGESKLDLHGLEDLASLPPLQGLTRIREVDLSRTGILDITTLPEITKLETLNLDNTPCENFDVLRQLKNLRQINLRFTQFSELDALASNSKLDTIFLWGSKVTNISFLPRLRNLAYLDLDETNVVNFEPLSRVSTLSHVYLSKTKISDLRPFTNLPALAMLEISGTDISDLEPLRSRVTLQQLAISNTKVTDLSPLAKLTSLIDGALERDSLGLHFAGCPLVDKNLVQFSGLKNPDRTIRTINYLRTLEGLASYDGKTSSAEDRAARIETPEPLNGVPSPFDFKLTAQGTIAVAGSDSNVPTFPFTSSRKDHSRRLEACRLAAEDAMEALSANRYQARSEYLNHLRKYAGRLPTGPDDGNILLADAQARAVRGLFASDAEILAPGLATLLKTLLEQHIGLRAFYPELAAFYQDVRDGGLSQPLPLDAVEVFAQGVRDFTPAIFEPSVSQAIGEAREPEASPPSASPEAPPPSDQTIRPPVDPNGDIESGKSWAFTVASTANRLWRAFLEGEKVNKAVDAWAKAAHTLGPPAHALIQWLSKFLESGGHH